MQVSQRSPRSNPDQVGGGAANTAPVCNIQILSPTSTTSSSLNSTKSRPGAATWAKGSFVQRALGLAVLLMVITTGVLLSLLLRSSNILVDFKVEQVNVSAEILVSPLADILRLSESAFKLHSTTRMDRFRIFTFNMDSKGRDRLIDMANRGDPRLNKLALVSIDDTIICPVGKKGPGCSECAESFGFTGPECTEYSTPLQEADPFALALPVCNCDSSERLKCVKSIGSDAIRVVNLPDNTACVMRMDNGVNQPSKMILGTSKPIVTFTDHSVGRSLPFVALYGGFDKASFSCTGTFQGYVWCYNELPCQDCPNPLQCHNGSICEPALPGNGQCLQCPPAHFGLQCEKCSAACQKGCSDGFAGSGDCLCDNNRMGAQCDQCQSGYYGPNCQQCLCSSKGICDDGIQGLGICTCEKNFAGPTCDRCAPGFTGIDCNICAENHYGPDCLPCVCGELGDCVGGSETSPAQCVCRHPNVAGPDCADCQSGYYGPTCSERCTCEEGMLCSDGIRGDGRCYSSDTSSISNPTNQSPHEVMTISEKQIDCQPGSGYYGPNCFPCRCLHDGICRDGRQGDGSCLCALNFSGQHCERCSSGRFGSICDQVCPTCPSPLICDEGIEGTGNCVARKPGRSVSV